MANDALADVLNIEDNFYKEGYQRGFDDGLQAGKIEGRYLGLEQGFEKFSASARLGGRAIIWANRTPQMYMRTDRYGHGHGLGHGHGHGASAETDDDDAHRARPSKLPDLPDNPRLVKQITTLYALVESESLSTENTDEAVNDFDDRIKRARGKVKIIERMVDESPGSASAKSRASGSPRTSQAENT